MFWMSDKPLKYQHLNEKYLIWSGLLFNSDNGQLYQSQYSKAFVPKNLLVSQYMYWARCMYWYLIICIELSEFIGISVYVMHIIILVLLLHIIVLETLHAIIVLVFWLQIRPISIQCLCSGFDDCGCPVTEFSDINMNRSEQSLFYWVPLTSLLCLGLHSKLYSVLFSVLLGLHAGLHLDL